MTFKLLFKKRPLQTKVWAATHYESRWLCWLAVLFALSQKLLFMNQTGAAVGPQCSCTDQDSIGPGQSLLKNVPIARTTQLSGTSRSRRKPSIQADSKHKTNRRSLHVETVSVKTALAVNLSLIHI